MKLSDAILLGSTASPQRFYILCTEDGGSCALGSAMIAVGTKAFADIMLLWPWVTARGDSQCPACDLRCEMVASTIAHLNDIHRWTREAIAEFVASSEPQEPEACTENEQTEAVEVFV